MKCYTTFGHPDFTLLLPAKHIIIKKMFLYFKQHFLEMLYILIKVCVGSG